MGENARGKGGEAHKAKAQGEDCASRSSLVIPAVLNLLTNSFSTVQRNSPFDSTNLDLVNFKIFKNQKYVREHNKYMSESSKFQYIFESLELMGRFVELFLTFAEDISWRGVGTTMAVA